MSSLVFSFQIVSKNPFSARFSPNRSKLFFYFYFLKFSFFSVFIFIFFCVCVFLLNSIFFFFVSPSPFVSQLNLPLSIAADINISAFCQERIFLFGADFRLYVETDTIKPTVIRTLPSTFTLYFCMFRKKKKRRKRRKGFNNMAFISSAMAIFTSRYRGTPLKAIVTILLVST